ncbi:unnamed protein product [Kuraishia capsulata CBS 1993]|uniref:Chitinase n=1 Tax=Kuraishia capsulata CBS 1993 TaxID=1382522 RepID=W6MLK3_9ASCO|nr:uncharacterized protein KUCA_T00003349001 [Kuraishia capsulata CBS 1993]CDK27371.1 unnamed protein product [Kuraishia capsulata CBS 1993]
MKLRSLFSSKSDASIPVSSAPMFSPYIYAWARSNPHYRVSTLKQAHELGLSCVTLAFVTDQKWDEVEAWIDDIAAFEGKVIISFGGAIGTYPSGSIEAEYRRAKKLIVKSGAYGVDFDIENDQMILPVNVAKIALIAKQLQQDLGLYVSLTLSVSLSGLESKSINVIRTFVRQGVDITVINSMTMDFYTPISTSWGIKTVEILKCVERQLEGIYKHNVRSKVGVCPMIGFNDDGTFFSAEDMRHVTAYAKQRELGMVTFWALNRDQVGKGDINLFSGGMDYEYTKIVLEGLKE